MIVAELDGTGTAHIGFPLVSAQVSIKGCRNVDKKREEGFDVEMVKRKCQCTWDKRIGIHRVTDVTSYIICVMAVFILI